MTPADELRTAAARLRSFDTTAGPWAEWRDLDHQGFVTIGDQAGVLSEERPDTTDCNPVAHVYTHGDAAHIAAMHPGVGLALAVLLESVVSQSFEDSHEECSSWCTQETCDLAAALSVARQILGTTP